MKKTGRVGHTFWLTIYGLDAKIRTFYWKIMPPSDDKCVGAIIAQTLKTRMDFDARKI